MFYPDPVTTAIDLRELSAHAAFDPQAGGHTCRAEHADRGVAAHRDERTGGDRAAVAGRGEQGELGHGGVGDVAEAHQAARCQADLAQPVGERQVRLQVLGHLVAGDLQGRCFDEHRRHAVVHAGHGHTVDVVPDVAGGQQRILARRELDHHGRRRPRHARDLGVSRVVHAAARGGEGRRRVVAGVDHADTDGGLLLPRRHQPALDGERTDAGEDVPAVLTAAHLRPVDHDLEKEVVDVGAGVGGGRDHGHLAGERVRAAQAVDLPLVGAAHDAQQQLVAQGRFGGQVVGQEVGTLGGAAPHQQTGHPLGYAGHDRSPAYSSYVRYSTPSRVSVSLNP